MQPGGRPERRRELKIGHDWRPLRWPVALPATLCEARARPLAVRLTELSVTGCRVQTGAASAAGKRVKITMAGFAPFEGAIVWARAGEVALRFDRPLHMAILRHVVAESERTTGTRSCPYAADEDADAAGTLPLFSGG